MVHSCLGISCTHSAEATKSLARLGENWVSVVASLTYFDMRKRGKERRVGKEEEKKEGEGGRQDERWEIFMIKIAFFVWK